MRKRTRVQNARGTCAFGRCSGGRLVEPARQTTDDQAHGQEWSGCITRSDQHGVACTVAFELGQGRKQVEEPSFWGEQSQRVPTEANDQMSAGVEHGGEIAGMRKSTVRYPE